MDKLLPNRKYEKQTSTDRRTNESENNSNHLEAMENESQKGVGITQTRNWNETSNSNGKNGRQIHGGRSQPDHKTSNNKRKTD